MKNGGRFTGLTRRYILPYTPYFIVSLLILGPLLAPGFVLTMDMVFTPQIRLPDHLGNTYLLYALLHALNWLLPADLIQKLLLASILVLGGMGMHRLMNYFWSRRLNDRLPLAQALACYVAGLFFIVNPFVYSRFMMGQFEVLFGLALVPWFVRELFKFFEEPSWRAALRLSFWTTVISIVSIHTLGMLALVVLLAWLWQLHWRGRVYWQGLCRGLSLWAISFALLGSYWLVPTILGQGRIAESIQTFSQAGRQVFATSDSNNDGLLSVLGLQGFWADARGLYLLPRDTSEAWWTIRALLWLAVLLGLIIAWRRHRREAGFFSSLLVVGFILTLGIGADWLVDHLPFFAGYREPQKFMVLVVLAYAYCLGVGSAWLSERLRMLKWAPPIILGLMVVLYTPTMFWGFYGQLSPRLYPSDWHYINQELNRQKARDRALFLPWHLYMSYDFTDRIIASPAKRFFDIPVIASDDPELGNAKPQFHDPLKAEIGGQLLPQAAQGQPITSRLKQLNIRYILLAKELDYQKYISIDSQPGVHVQVDTPTLRLYRID